MFGIMNVDSLRLKPTLKSLLIIMVNLPVEVRPLRWTSNMILDLVRGLFHATHSTFFLSTV